MLGSCGTTNTSPGLDDEFPEAEGPAARSHPLYDSLQASARAVRLHTPPPPRLRAPAAGFRDWAGLCRPRCSLDSAHP